LYGLYGQTFFPYIRDGSKPLELRFDEPYIGEVGKGNIGCLYNRKFREGVVVRVGFVERFYSANDAIRKYGLKTIVPFARDTGHLEEMLFKMGQGKNLLKNSPRIF